MLSKLNFDHGTMTPVKKGLTHTAFWVTVLPDSSCNPLSSLRAENKARM